MLDKFRVEGHRECALSFTLFTCAYHGIPPSLPRYFRQLNPDREVPPLLIDTDAFSSALSAGDLDVCLQLLRSRAAASPPAALLNCRAAEALFHSGRCDEALECGRRAFALAADDRGTADFCAWLFSNCIGINATPASAS